MKCLSVRQPWAWAIVNGIKDVENRDWYTSFRGPLLIHAAKTFGRDEREDIEYVEDIARIKLPKPDEYTLGAVVGGAVVIDCTKQQSSKWHMSFSFGWYLNNAVAFAEPIPLRGSLGLFDVPNTQSVEVELFAQKVLGAA